MRIPPIRILPATPSAAFLGSAEALLAGVKVMADADPAPAIPLTLIAGFTLECALKSFLVRKNIDEKRLRTHFGHNVEELWRESRTQGLSLEDPAPAWLAQLSRVYERPYMVRYPMGVHGLVLPNSEQLASGVNQVVAKVRAAST